MGDNFCVVWVLIKGRHGIRITHCRTREAHGGSTRGGNTCLLSLSIGLTLVEITMYNEGM